MSDARDALPGYTQDEIDSECRMLRNGNCKVAADMIERYSRAARAQAEGGTVPRQKPCQCGATDWVPGDYQCAACGNWVADVSLDAAPRASEAIPAGAIMPNYDPAGRYVDPQPAPAAAPADPHPLIDMSLCADEPRVTPIGTPAPTDNAALIAEIDAWIAADFAPWNDLTNADLLQRCRDRLAQPAITDAEVAACLEPLPDTLAHTYYRAEQMQGVIRKLVGKP